MNTHYIIIALICFISSSCMKDSYKTDKTYELSKQSKKTHHFWAKQAHELTSQNIEDREKNEKKARKKSLKQQEELNSANSKTSKAAKKKNFSGEFSIY
jgi:hypothetical protein